MRIILLGLLLLAGCTYYLGNEIPGAAQQGLEHTDWAILYTLDPAKPVAPGGKALDGFTVVEKVTLAGDDAQEAAAEVKAAIDAGRGTTDCVFKPDHALRVRQDYHTYDFLLSYDCGIVEIFEDHHSLAWHGIDGYADDLDVIMETAKIRPPATGK